MKRLRHALLTIAGAVALTAGLAACHYLGVAHAAAEGPAPTAGFDWTATVAVIAIVLAGVSTLLSGLSTVLHVIAPRTKTTIDDAMAAGVDTVHDKLDELLGIVNKLKPPASPVVVVNQTGPARDPQAGRVSLVTVLALVVTLGTGIAVIACTSAKQRGAASVGAFVDCEAPEVAGVLPDLIPLAKDALMLAISGDGHVDTTRLKADMAPAKSALVQCAIAAAVAALATPAPKVPGAPAAAGMEIDGAALRGAFAAARGELGWAPVRLAGGAEL